MRFKVVFLNERDMSRITRHYKTNTEVIFEGWEEITKIALRELVKLQSLWYVIDTIEYVGR